MLGSPQDSTVTPLDKPQCPMEDKAICSPAPTIVKLCFFFYGASQVAQMVKESACNLGDPGSIPWSGRSPGEGNGNLVQYSYLENPIDRGA